MAAAGAGRARAGRRASSRRPCMEGRTAGGPQGFPDRAIPDGRDGPRAPECSSMTSPPPTPPTEEQPPPQPPRDDDRRWVRSSSDRMIAGVAGGLGRRLDVDPLAIRITFVILSFAGGLGILAYLAGLVFMQSDDPESPPLQWGLARTVGAGLLVVAGLAILLPGWAWGPGIPLLAVGGIIVYLLLRVLREQGTPS